MPYMVRLRFLTIVQQLCGIKLTLGLLAHQEAFEKCNIIHRDVSAGNILIFPVINYLARNRCFAVSMKGLLSDWELAKIIVEKTFATQPQRTVSATTFHGTQLVLTFYL